MINENCSSHKNAKKKYTHQIRIYNNDGRGNLGINEELMIVKNDDILQFERMILYLGYMIYSVDNSNQLRKFISLGRIWPSAREKNRK